VIEVTAGSYHTCAVLDSGSVRCWGYGAFGQLGTGATDIVGDGERPSDVPELNLGVLVQHVRPGRNHTCAMLEGGTVRCWGQGRYGALGRGDTANLGDDEDVAAATDIDLGGIAIEVAAGQQHSCALLDTHAVRCWGYGKSGVLGAGNTQTLGDDETPSAHGSLALGSAAFGLSSTNNHACAMFTQGIKCWGEGSSGQLGYGSETSLGDDESLENLGWVDLGLN
jgi:hypothetical protein